MIRTIRSVTAGFVVAIAMAVGLTTVGIAPASAAGSWTTVAKTAEGKMKSKIVGKTSTGRKVTGSFKPKKFIEKDGKVWAKGVIRGEFENAAGKTKTFKVKRKVPVKKINGTPATARAAARADCDVLNLVLGPLDLNVLGLTVNLNRLVLDIVAVSGAGNLLGNLLCAVAGLLDGGGLLSNLLGQITDLLNQILGRLGLAARTISG
ncbi:ABC transporter substrate-binding protein [Nocardioides sediminis]|uniref:ABC transporter substrate-binding protein n=1 Tax=Nocardioides sediminis TaxID=433648 RepID=UPI000D30D769|nr:ABC transporter substrate-binding protein [Nocardioides sediminis]